jgi:hydroxymethylbilane synthase
MGFADRISYVFPVEEMVPAIGQGSLSIEIREDDRQVLELISSLEDANSRRCVMAEREFLRQMGGGCQVPMGAHAALKNTRSHFFAFVASPSGAKMIRRSFAGKVEDLDRLVARAVEFFRAQGAEEILAEVTSK